MTRSPVMNNDENNRQEFKERTLRRVYNALNPTAKKVKKSGSKEIIVKGLIPRKEE